MFFKLITIVVLVIRVTCCCGEKQEIEAPFDSEARTLKVNEFPNESTNCDCDVFSQSTKRRMNGANVLSPTPSPTVVLGTVPTTTITISTNPLTPSPSSTPHPTSIPTNNIPNSIIPTFKLSPISTTESPSIETAIPTASFTDTPTHVSTTNSSPIGACQTSFPDWVGDGWCDFGQNGDADLNTAECGYDGGDCCETTCSDNDSATYRCGINGYRCKDPGELQSEPVSANVSFLLTNITLSTNSNSNSNAFDNEANKNNQRTRMLGETQLSSENQMIVRRAVANLLQLNVSTCNIVEANLVSTGTDAVSAGASYYAYQITANVAFLPSSIDNTSLAYNLSSSNLAAYLNESVYNGNLQSSVRAFSAMYSSAGAVEWAVVCADTANCRYNVTHHTSTGNSPTTSPVPIVAHTTELCNKADNRDWDRLYHWHSGVPWTHGHPTYLLLLLCLLFLWVCLALCGLAAMVTKFWHVSSVQCYMYTAAVAAGVVKIVYFSSLVLMPITIASVQSFACAEFAYQNFHYSASDNSAEEVNFWYVLIVVSQSAFYSLLVVIVNTRQKWLEILIRSSDCIVSNVHRSMPRGCTAVRNVISLLSILYTVFLVVTTALYLSALPSIFVAIPLFGVTLVQQIVAGSYILLATLWHWYAMSGVVRTPRMAWSKRNSRILAHRPPHPTSPLHNSNGYADEDEQFSSVACTENLFETAQLERFHDQRVNLQRHGSLVNFPSIVPTSNVKPQSDLVHKPQFYPVDDDVENQLHSATPNNFDGAAESSQVVSLNHIPSQLCSDLDSNSMNTAELVRLSQDVPPTQLSTQPQPPLWNNLTAPVTTPDTRYHESVPLRVVTCLTAVLMIVSAIPRSLENYAAAFALYSVTLRLCEVALVALSVYFNDEDRQSSFTTLATRPPHNGDVLTANHVAEQSIEMNANFPSTQHQGHGGMQMSPPGSESRVSDAPAEVLSQQLDRSPVLRSQLSDAFIGGDRTYSSEGATVNSEVCRYSDDRPESEDQVWASQWATECATKSPIHHKRNNAGLSWLSGWLAQDYSPLYYNYNNADEENHVKTERTIEEGLQGVNDSEFVTEQQSHVQVLQHNSEEQAAVQSMTKSTTVGSAELKRVRFGSAVSERHTSASDATSTHLVSSSQVVNFLHSANKQSNATTTSTHNLHPPQHRHQKTTQSRYMSAVSGTAYSALDSRPTHRSRPSPSSVTAIDVALSPFKYAIFEGSAAVEEQEQVQKVAKDSHNTVLDVRDTGVRKHSVAASVPIQQHRSKSAPHFWTAQDRLRAIEECLQRDEDDNSCDRDTGGESGGESDCSSEHTSTSDTTHEVE